MNVLDAIILGATQGVTEFLPISSDGHLVVAQRLLGIETVGRDALGFDILLHCGSLIAIAVGFRDVWISLVAGMLRRDAAAWRMAGLIAIATVPGVIAGLFLQDVVAEMRSLTAAAVGFLITAACLVAGERAGRARPERTSAPTAFEALLIGVAQACAILPGVSRSGLTVATGRALGVGRESALNFSFLMAVPIIAGAVAKTVLDVFDGEVIFPAASTSAAGFATSLVVSLCAIVFLRRFVKRNSFAWFAWYLVPLAALLIAEDFGLRELLDAEHATEAVRALGAVAVFAFAIVEFIPPFCFFSPGISALVIAGSLAPDGMTALTFGVTAFAASLAGNAALYCIGVFAGPSFERAIRLPDDAKKKAEAFVTRAGVWAVIGGQFVGALRPTVSFAAGALKMHPAKFASAAVAGAALWSLTSLGAGYLLRENVVVVVSVVASFGVVGVVAIAALGAWKWYRSHRDTIR
jgi:undecaprenyl-diphosphatase